MPTYQELNEYAVDQAFEAPIVFLGTTWATADGIVIVDYGGAPSRPCERSRSAARPPRGGSKDPLPSPGLERR